MLSSFKKIEKSYLKISFWNEYKNKDIHLPIINRF